MKKFLLLLVSLIGISLLQGFVINVFYEWFVQAAFHLPKVSFLVFSGIVMVRQYIVASPDDDLKSGTSTHDAKLYLDSRQRPAHLITFIMTKSSSRIS